MTDAIFEYPTRDEQPFVDAVCARPADPAPRRIFADWLDEQGDPRGEWLRASLEIEQAIDDLGWGFAFSPWRPIAWQLLADDSRLSEAFRICGETAPPVWKDLPETLRRTTTGHDFCGGFVENVSIGLAGLSMHGEAIRRMIPLRGVELMTGLRSDPPVDFSSWPREIWDGIERIADGSTAYSSGIELFADSKRGRQFAEATPQITALWSGPAGDPAALAAFLNVKPIESLNLRITQPRRLPEDLGIDIESLLAMWSPANLRCLGLEWAQASPPTIAALADWPGLSNLRLLHFPNASLGKRSRRVMAKSTYRHPDLCLAFPFESRSKPDEATEGIRCVNTKVDFPWRRGSNGALFGLYG